jgi:hypothetical protein
MKLIQNIKKIFQKKIKPISTNKKEYKENLDYLFSFTNDLLNNKKEITNIHQLQCEVTTIDPVDLSFLEELNKKYSCNIIQTLYNQTEPVSIQKLIKRKQYFIQSGWRFTFREKTMDVLLDSNHHFILGNPSGIDQYILSRQRDYKGRILITSNICPAVEAIFDCVESELFKKLLGDESQMDYDYHIDLKNRTFERITRN